VEPYFLLEQLRRELRLTTGKKETLLRLGPGGLGYGPEKVFVKDMGKPGVPEE